MVTFQKVLFEAQLPIFFISWRSHVLLLQYSIFHIHLKPYYQLPKLWHHAEYLHNQVFQMYNFDVMMSICTTWLSKCTTTLSNIHTSFISLYVHIHKLSPFLVWLMYITGPILESKGMHAIFQEKGKKGKMFENLKIFWKRAASCVQLSHAWNR